MSLEYETFLKNKYQALADGNIDPKNYFIRSMEGAYFCIEVKHVRMMIP